MCEWHNKDLDGFEIAQSVSGWWSLSSSVSSIPCNVSVCGLWVSNGAFVWVCCLFQYWIFPWRTLAPDKDMTAVNEIRLACKGLFKKGIRIVIINFVI